MLYKLSDRKRWIVGLLLNMSITLNAAVAEQAKGEKSILVLGDSLSAGWGLDEQESYPALLEEKLKARGSLYKVINAGVSGDTTAGGLARINWLLKNPVDILILALGANDGLRGFSPEVTKKNLSEIIKRVQSKYPEVKVVILGMRLPPNFGARYTESFFQLFAEVAAEHNAHLLPFLLDGVAGNRELSFPDGLHPNAAGQKVLAENVWAVLEPLLD